MADHTTPQNGATSLPPGFNSLPEFDRYRFRTTLAGQLLPAYPPAPQDFKFDLAWFKQLPPELLSTVESNANIGDSFSRSITEYQTRRHFDPQNMYEGSCSCIPNACILMEGLQGCTYRSMEKLECR